MPVTIEIRTDAYWRENEELRKADGTAYVFPRLCDATNELAGELESDVWGRIYDQFPGEKIVEIKLVLSHPLIIDTPNRKG